MKSALLLICMLIPIASFSQQSNADIQKLLQVTNEGIMDHKDIGFDERENNLIISDLIIPVSKETLVKRIKHKGHHSVEFSLQEGTAITSTANSDFRKAWLILEFKSRAQAKDFIKHFKNISKG